MRKKIVKLAKLVLKKHSYKTGKWEKLANMIAIAENCRLELFAVSQKECCVGLYSKDTPYAVEVFCKHVTRDGYFKKLCKKYFSRTKMCKSAIELRYALKTGNAPE